MRTDKYDEIVAFRHLQTHLKTVQLRGIKYKYY
jgi:hypothetical protein